MEDSLVTYFFKEKSVAQLMMIIGVTGVFFALLGLVFNRKKFFIGFLYPTSIFSVILLFLGGYVFFQTPDQLSSLKLMLLGTPDSFYNLEFMRVNSILEQIKFYMYAEIGVATLGVVLCFIARKTRGFVFGLGISLFLYSMIFLSLDLNSKTRNIKYLRALENQAQFE